MVKNRRAFGGVILALFVGACAPSNVYIARDIQPARRLAILPMANQSNNLSGPVYIRQVIADRLAARGYQLIPLTEIDAKLREQGFTDGGQLKMATPQQIGQWLGADTLFYGNVEKFDFITLGFYFQRRVKISARLVNAQTGERLWEAERGYSTQQVATNRQDAERLTAVELAARSVENMAHVPLGFESRAAVTLLLKTLPERP